MSASQQNPQYSTYRGLPPLAGLTSMDRAIATPWSVEESVRRLKRLHYVLRRLYETLTARITAEPIYELKTAFSHHAYLCAEYVTAMLPGSDPYGELCRALVAVAVARHPGLVARCEAEIGRETAPVCLVRA